MRIRVGLPRKWQLLWAAVVLGGMAALAIAQPSSGRSGQIVPLGPDTPGGAALVERLHEGGLVMYFRHADTTGTTCDRTYRIGDRAGQRNTGVSSRDASALRCRHSRFLSTIPC